MRVSARSGIACSWSVTRQLEPEARAAARAVLEADVALHHLHQPLADREAEAGAALLARGGRVGLREAAEDAVAEPLRNAAAAVVDRDAHLAVAVLGGDLDDAAFGGELDGIRQQIGHHLLQPLAVRVHRALGKIAAGLEAHLE